MMEREGDYEIVSFTSKAEGHSCKLLNRYAILI
jgi:hypothetical protein